MSEWCEIKLGELITDIAAGPFGSNLKVACFVDEGFPIIDGANLKSFKVTDNITKFVTEEKARSLKRSIAKRHDVVVTISGTLGQISYIPHDSQYAEYLCSQRQFRATFDESRVNVPFLVYYFHTWEGQQRILAYANRVGVPALFQPLKNFREIKIPLPDLPTQRRIAAVLGALDDKIENNRKICENLEAQAQALFKSWFVDFEPWGGKMPEGWKKGKLRDIAGYDNRRIAASNLTVETYFSTENMLTDRGGVVAAASIPQSGEVPLCEEGSVLVSNIRPYFKKIYRATETAGHSADVLCFEAKDSSWQWYLYRLLWDDAFFAYVMSGVKGCKMPRGDKEQILDYGCVIPGADNVAEFNAVVEPMCQRITHCNKESRALAEMRDALLPQLMLGRLRVDATACQGEIDVGKVEI